MAKNKIKINNQAWIIDNGYTHTTYSDMFETLGFKNKNHNEVPEKGETGRVFGIGADCISKRTLYAIVNDEGEEFLVEEKGVMLVKITTIAQQLKVTKFPFTIKDDNKKNIYSESSYGYWGKREFDGDGNQIYYENSDGIIKDMRPKPVPEHTMEELVNKLGHNFKIKK